MTQNVLGLDRDHYMAMWAQSTTLDVTTCNRCACVSGDLIDQLHAIADMHGDGAYVRAHAGEATRHADQGQWDGRKRRGGEEPAGQGAGGGWVKCALGCGLSYCGESCRSADASVHHLLCVGPVDEAHPLYLFKVACLQSEVRLGPWAIAAKVAAMEWLSLQRAAAGAGDEGGDGGGAGGAAVDTETHLGPASRLMRRRGPTTQASSDDEAGPDEGEAGAWGHLAAGLAAGGVDVAVLTGGMDGPAWWSKLVQAVMRWVLEDKDMGEGTTPMLEWCGRLVSVGEEERAEAEALLKACGVLATWDDGPENDDNGDDNNDGIDTAGDDDSAAAADDDNAADNHDYDEDDDDDNDEEEELSMPSFGQLLAEPKRYLPPPTGLVLVLGGDVDTASPSCIPSATWHFGKKDAAAREGGDVLWTWRLDRPRRDGEALTLPWVDIEQSYEDRQEEYAMRGLDRCECGRCVWESRKEGQGAEARAGRQTPAVLRDIATLAMEHGRNEDALEALEEMIRRNGKDGIALADRVTVLGWMGRWTDAVAALEHSHGVASDHPRVRDRWKAHLAYHPSTDPPRTAKSRVAPTTAGEVHAGARGRLAGTPVGGGLRDVDGGRRIFASEGEWMEPEGCRQVIQAAEAHAEAVGGWDTQRHYDVPTTDLPVHSVKAVLSWFTHGFQTRLAPAVAMAFDEDPALIRVIDAFVVKYSARRQRSLPVHCDQSQYSFTVALNDPAEYVGGGTYFPHLDQAVNTGEGGIVLFKGDVAHGGHAISSGTRYIVAVFCYADGAGSLGSNGGFYHKRP